MDGVAREQASIRTRDGVRLDADLRRWHLSVIGAAGVADGTPRAYAFGAP